MSAHDVRTFVIALVVGCLVTWFGRALYATWVLS